MMTRRIIPRTIPLDCAEFYNEDAILKEIRRVFDICNTCRKCFNLCALFPKLFESLDREEIDGDVEALTLAEIDDIVPLCNLCDMCFIAKCPYVPPHPWNVDFPRLMLRYRAMKKKKSLGYQGWVSKNIASVDNYGAIGCGCSKVINPVMKIPLARKPMEWVTGVDAKASLPVFRPKPLTQHFKPPLPNAQGPAFGKAFVGTDKKTFNGKVALYATCLNQYYNFSVAQAASAILAHWGMEVSLVYPGCCGMPLMEQGLLHQVRHQAETLAPILDQHSTLIALTPSCALMVRQEWPSLCPDNTAVVSVANKTWDLSRFLLHWAKVLKIQPVPLPANIVVHMACHARAQNQGNSGFELLRHLSLSPSSVSVVQRCSGHGGFWGYMHKHFLSAVHMGDIVVKEAMTKGNLSGNTAKNTAGNTTENIPAEYHLPHDAVAQDPCALPGAPSCVLVTDCPLAMQHLEQVYKSIQGSIQDQDSKRSPSGENNTEKNTGVSPPIPTLTLGHPAILLAKAMGLGWD